MRHLLLYLILSLALTPVLSAQATPLLRDGEARSDRSEVSTLWVNPVLLQPSVFFDKQEVQQRGDRKWWRRQAAPLLPSVDFTLNEEVPAPRSTPSLNTSTLLSPINFGQNIPPVTPLWERESSSYQSK